MLFAVAPDKGHDVHGLLFRAADGSWVLDYRFRYYADDKVHDSEDRKSRYKATFDKSRSEAYARQGVKTLLAGLEAMGYVECDYTEIGSDRVAYVTHVFGQKPYLHTRFEPAEEKSS
jgi:hypothetical protein